MRAVPQKEARSPSANKVVQICLGRRPVHALAGMVRQVAVQDKQYQQGRLWEVTCSHGKLLLGPHWVWRRASWQKGASWVKSTELVSTGLWESQLVGRDGKSH